MEKGRVAHSPLFTLRWIPTEGHTCIAAIVPKKVVKKATGRNSLRRKVYIAVRVLGTQIISGFKIVILAKTPMTDVAQEAINKALYDSVSKARLVK
jgi:ribonuclease P protein component